MDISEFSNAYNDAITAYATGFLGARNLFVSGDEYLYEFLGKNSSYGFDTLMLEEDRDEFYSAMNEVRELGEGAERHLIARVRNYNDHYRTLYIKLSYNHRIYENTRLVECSFNDCVKLQQKYLASSRNLNKYRKFLELSRSVYFEYTYADDILLVYKYVGTKSVTLGKISMNELKSKVERWPEERISGVDRYDLLKLIDDIQKGYDDFNGIVSMDALHIEGLAGVYQVIGGTAFHANGNMMTVGMLVPDKMQAEEAYYKTEAAKDSGTGLLNKRAITEYTMDRMKVIDNLYFAIIDVDDFKTINDTYGHMFGDDVLRTIANTFRDVLGSRGIIGRFGGDEFIVVFENVTEEVLRRIIKTANKQIKIAYIDGDKNPNITLSIGIAQYKKDAADFETIFRLADKCLYIAKEKGKNRFIIYDINKHGPLEDAEDSERTTGISSVVPNDVKHAKIADLIVDLYKRKDKALRTVLKNIRDYFDIDGIRIFKGCDFERIYSTGKYINAPKNMPELGCEKVYDRFAENDICIFTRTSVIEELSPELYAALLKSEIVASIFIIQRKGSKITAVMTFDLFNQTRKWSKYDVHMLNEIARLILCDLDAFVPEDK